MDTRIKIALILVALSCLVTLVWIVGFPGAVKRGQCMDNLRILAKAKQAYAGENDLREDDTISLDTLMPYATDPSQPLTCPAGGTYRLNPVGQPPTCSAHPELQP